MNTSNFSRITRGTRTLGLTAAFAAIALTAACSKSEEDRTAGEKLDAAVATTEQKAAEVKADVKQEMQELKTEAGQATAKVGTALDDASITARVNAGLTADAQLSALKIDVDTRNGSVVLKGTAPDADARQRATTIAAGVEGVSSVDNRLQVGG